MFVKAQMKVPYLHVNMPVEENAQKDLQMFVKVRLKLELKPANVSRKKFLNWLTKGTLKIFERNGGTIFF